MNEKLDSEENLKSWLPLYEKAVREGALSSGNSLERFMDSIKAEEFFDLFIEMAPGGKPEREELLKQMYNAFVVSTSRANGRFSPYDVFYRIICKDFIPENSELVWSEFKIGGAPSKREKKTEKRISRDALSRATWHFRVTRGEDTQHLFRSLRVKACGSRYDRELINRSIEAMEFLLVNYILRKERAKKYFKILHEYYTSPLNKEEWESLKQVTSGTFSKSMREFKKRYAEFMRGKADEVGVRHVRLPSGDFAFLNSSEKDLFIKAYMVPRYFAIASVLEQMENYVKEKGRVTFRELLHHFIKPDFVKFISAEQLDYLLRGIYHYGMVIEELLKLQERFAKNPQAEFEKIFKVRSEDFKKGVTLDFFTDYVAVLFESEEDFRNFCKGSIVDGVEAVNIRFKEGDLEDVSPYLLSAFVFINGEENVDYEILEHERRHHINKFATFVSLNERASKGIRNFFIYYAIDEMIAYMENGYDIKKIRKILTKRGWESYDYHYLNFHLGWLRDIESVKEKFAQLRAGVKGLSLERDLLAFERYLNKLLALKKVSEKEMLEFFDKYKEIQLKIFMRINLGSEIQNKYASEAEKFTNVILARLRKSEANSKWHFEKLDELLRYAESFVNAFGKTQAKWIMAVAPYEHWRHVLNSKEEGLFNPEEIKKRFTRHLSY